MKTLSQLFLWTAALLITLLLTLGLATVYLNDEPCAPEPFDLCE